MTMLAIKRPVIVLLLLLLFSPLALPVSASHSRSDIRVTDDIGPKGGTITAEDEESGLIVMLSFPQGSLENNTKITLVLHGSRQAGIIGKTHINGITVLPEGLILLEKAQLSVFNPPADVTNGMILYRKAGDKLIIPLGDQVRYPDEGWLEGSFYITGKFGLGTPTASEVSEQCKRLSSYNPSRPLATSYDGPELLLKPDFTITADYSFQWPDPSLPEIPVFMSDEPLIMSIDPEECLRWQKALTKVEGHMFWVEHFIYMNNHADEQAERKAAAVALQEAINGYLKKTPPSYKCGSYIKAAAKYTEAATLLGLNLGEETAIAQRFAQLVEECSFVFTVETREWINHPKTKHDDGATSEEKMNLYCTIECHIPWRNFLATGDMTVRGQGNKTLSHEKHWVGDDDNNSHETAHGKWQTGKIDGAVKFWEDEFGRLYPEASIRIFWDKSVSVRHWGKRPGNEKPYDFSGTDTGTEEQSLSFPLKNGYTESIGNDEYGRMIKVIIIKSPNDGRDNPNDCF